MRSLIVQKIVPLVLLVSAVFAAFLLSRGHDEPGGGFAAGIAATLGLLLQAVASGFRSARAAIERSITAAWGLGMVLASTSACLAMAAGEPFFTHASLPGAGMLGSTAMLFEAGIFLVVVGSVATTLAMLAEAARW